MVRVAGLDRLGRSDLAAFQAMEELEQGEVRVRSAKWGEDLPGATAELIRHIVLGMAQWKRRQMLERVAEARAGSVAAGCCAVHRRPC